MKKIFTLAAAVLASFSLWADPVSIANPATTTYGGITFLNVAETPANGYISASGATFEGDSAVVYGALYVGKQLAVTTWYNCSDGAPASNWDQSAYTYADAAINGFIDPSTASSNADNGYGDAKTHSGRIRYYYVTGTSSVAIMSADNGASKYITLKIEEVAENGDLTEVVADLSAASKGSNISIIEYDQPLNTSGYYKVSVSSNNSSNCKLYQIRFGKQTKTIVSTTEELINAKVNGVALEEGKLNDLKYGYLAMLDDYFITAPEVTFVKRVEITYDDESTKEDTVDVDVTAIESLEYSGMWQASFTLGETTYSVIAGIAEAYTVTYKLADETVLGTELVAAGEHPAEYAQYEVMPLSTFNGWYDSDYLETVDLSQVVVNSDMLFYADFDKAYAESIDFEGMVINNGKGYDVKSALTANFYDYKTIDALDSLNDAKGAARNEPYLGLKIKKQGGYLACNVLPGTTLRIKFGYVGDPVLAIAGDESTTLTPTDNKLADLVVPFMVEKLVKLQTTSDKTVVIKQIKIDQPIVTWMYPITYAAADHGTVSGWTIAFPGEEVKLSFTKDEGYTLVSCYANEQVIVSTPNVGEFFTMPAEAVIVNATFGDTATAIDNAEEEVKAVKVVRDGQLFIEKNGVLYNAQGAVVK